MNTLLIDNLLVTDTRDPAIKMPDRKTLNLDLLNYANQNDINNFLWGDLKELIINNASYVEIEESLNKTNDYIDFLDVCYECGISLTKTTTNLLSKNFNTYKKRGIEEAIKRSFGATKIFQTYKNAANKILEEDAIYPLFLTSHYITGKDINGNKINAPLVLWEVEIQMSSKKYKDS